MIKGMAKLFVKVDFDYVPFDIEEAKATMKERK